MTTERKKIINLLHTCAEPDGDFGIDNAIAFYHAAQAEALAKLNSAEPVQEIAWYDGNKFYVNYTSAICGCADMNKLQPVFTHPPEPSAVEVSDKHPIQPLAKDEHGVIRFKKNHIVDFLAAGKLNELATMDFPKEDYEQLAQLIGYSLSGFGTLPYVTDETYDRAEAMLAAERSGE